ncbi:isocitrate/isopropylmalate dehydrogenase family protein [Helicovermis profundi]|uniref:Isocitrate dehydrogenase (NAD(+)) n=1 Tax=Helicovermis profundi TaxID=3065157 RepID=A0AAU9EV07_9FIRM|nr:isocitrate dehydrogenase (NAD(+)) [Clostridia bacterium S502]
MKTINITLIKGDGIGPEVSDSAMKVINATGLKINWDIVNAGKDTFDKTGCLVPDDVFKSIEKNKIVLKAPITTPVASGFRSINVMLRKKYNLFSNIRPILPIDSLNTNYKKLDIVIFRENTEGLYIGDEEKIDENTFIAKKLVTRCASEKIISRAFEFAKENNRKKVTVVHKANILKETDGLFLKIAKEISKEFPSVILEDRIIDNMCMQLVMNPIQFDVIVTMNLYGDILSDLCSGFIGGLGLAPGANIGDDIAIFEAVHGSAPDIAGKNIANPSALILSGAMMLDYLDKHKEANLIRKSLNNILKEKTCLTRDLGGNTSTTDFTNNLIYEIEKQKNL